jgi:hypothetical protein
MKSKNLPLRFGALKNFPKIFFFHYSLIYFIIMWNPLETKFKKYLILIFKLKPSFSNRGYIMCRVRVNHTPLPKQNP